MPVRAGRGWALSALVRPLAAVPTEIPTPIIVTVIMTAEPGTDQEPIVITVVATRPPDNSRPPTATLEPTPTQWWPQATPADEPTLISPANTRESTPANATTNNAPYAGGDSAPIVLPEALPSHTPAEGLLSPPF